jgi:altronate dehydratase small subunit
MRNYRNSIHVTSAKLNIQKQVGTNIIVILMKKRYIIMNSDDNCATTLAEIPKDEKVELNAGDVIKINHSIPLGHKFALRTIKKGDFVRKYGEIIGVATENIERGDWIHIHNIKSYYLGMRKR